MKLIEKHNATKKQQVTHENPLEFLLVFIERHAWSHRLFSLI